MAEIAEILLERQSDVYVEVGTVVRRQGKHLTVLMLDGREEQIESRAGLRRVTRDSLQHDLLVAPERTREQLDLDAASVFKRVLAEAGKPMDARALKAELHSLGDDAVRKAWERARRKLELDVDIDKSDHKLPRYSLRRDVRPSDVALQSRQTGSSRSSATSGPPIAEQGDTAGPDLSGRQTTPPATDSASELAEADTGETPHTDSDRLAARLRETGVVETRREVPDRLMEPLAFGLLVRRLKADHLRQLLPEIDSEERRYLAAILGEGKEKVLADDVANLNPHEYSQFVDAAIREVNRAGKAREQLLPMLTALVRRAVDGGALTPDLLTRTASTFAQRPSQQSEEGLDLTLSAIATLLGHEEGNLRDWDLPLLSRSAGAAPLGRTGGRASLLAILYRLEPGEATDERWWRGVGFDQLVEAGRGPLAKAMEDPSVATTVVKPVVEATVAETSSRSGLARLWAAPPPVARWVKSDSLSAAMARTGQGDSLMRTWLDELTNRREADRLANELRAARSAEQEQLTALETLQRQSDQLKAQVVSLSAELAAARSAGTAVTQAHERQAKLDLLKTLARVCAQVAQSRAASQDPELQQNVAFIASREGLSPVGTPGQQAAFDPAIHDSIGLTISPGSPVNVSRPGYTWTAGQETLVVLKAVVVPQGE